MEEKVFVLSGKTGRIWVSKSAPPTGHTLKCMITVFGLGVGNW